MAFLDGFNRGIKRITDIEAHIDTDAAERSIRNNIIFRGPNAWILAIAIMIASIGLNVNSMPVIIGAMLISPLMGPIFGIGLGLGINDVNLMKQAGKNLLIMVSISLGVSLLYFMITPLELTNPTELIARTQPTIFDVMIALFGGLAGIFELCRKEKGTVFSGVAIATALMPPLCTAGCGLATGNISWFLGALYLFAINCLFITLATYILVKYFQFKKMEYADKKSGQRTQRITSALILVFLVPSVWFAVTLVQQNDFEKRANQFIDNYIHPNSFYIVEHEFEHKDESSLILHISGKLDDDDKAGLYACADKYGLVPEEITIHEYNNSQEVEDLIKKNMVSTISTTSSTIDNTAMIHYVSQKDTEIAIQKNQIEHLQNQLDSLKQRKLRYESLANEIKGLYPAIKELYIGYGAFIDMEQLGKPELPVITDSTALADSTVIVGSITKSSTIKKCLMIEVKTEKKMKEEEINQFNNWLHSKPEHREELIHIDNTVMKIEKRK